MRAWWPHRHRFAPLEEMTGRARIDPLLYLSLLPGDLLDVCVRCRVVRYRGRNRDECGR